MKRIHYAFLWISLLAAPIAKAQDSLSLNLPDAEQQFNQKNLQLIAARLGIAESKAYEIQAGLKPNPSVYLEHMPYNTQKKEIGGFSSNNAQQVVQYQQLIEVAGKRSKRLALARLGTEQAQNQVQSLLRDLQYALRTTFYDLYYQQQQLKVYDEEILTLQQTVSLYQQQYDKGNVPLKDLARLKAYLFNLNSERQTILATIADDEADLNILTANRGKYFIAAANLPEVNLGQFKIGDLLTQAEDNRSDLNLIKTGVKLENQNLILQKALAKPDVNLQFTYDRNGGYISNYLGVGVGVTLPFFNKNQGNIEAAKIRVQSSQAALQAYQLQVQQNVITAFNKALQADKMYQTFDNRFAVDFSKLIDGVILNYKKQNIDVVEFIDFFDSYKSTVIEFNQLQNNRMKAIEDLNYAVGKIII
ncbi:TolC family protein [Emticicia sp. 21SJ11W-3]|uniref:TolC family protein n=1 Tax=Emticicia sp. 21SJ11W-3 TaxID=2916755 RepID=UPI0020A124AA|nr:TolC family protein [Emticicia sp. 21SJ11W-3]UTA69896.1 TolC family protein [Emticicia sp. 21SJ11W-3]